MGVTEEVTDQGLDQAPSDAPALVAAAARPEGVEHQGAIAAALEALVGAPPPLAMKDWKSWAEAGSR